MDAKAGAREAFDRTRERLIALSERIHAHPELAFEEERAAGWIADALDTAGFTVTRGAFDLPTAESLGRVFPDLGRVFARAAGSTDMGNVSQVLPAIHPMIGIASLPAVNHQPEFTARCVGDSAEKALCEGALALGWTAIDLARAPALSARLHARTR
jgi:metal-dependent amidase/aminoacylase/carboxypeptidase family protein